MSYHLLERAKMKPIIVCKCNCVPNKGRRGYTSLTNSKRERAGDFDHIRWIEDEDDRVFIKDLDGRHILKTFPDRVCKWSKR